MSRETALAAGFAVVVVAMLLVAALAPGAVSRPEQPERPGRLDIEEVVIAPGAVSGATADLRVDTRLVHYGGPSENVTLQFRAVSLDSGMLETDRTVDVGTVAGDRERSVNATLTVARQGGYRIETIVYRNGSRVAQGSREVRGVGTLQPAYARTPVRFHDFSETSGSDLPVVEYSVADVNGNRTTLDVLAHLTNAGDEPAGDVRVVFKARQADSNIVADQVAVDVGSIEAGRTATPSAELTVPDGYNYYLDAVLWKDGVIVGSTRSAANLNPTETLTVNETTREIGLDVGDFEREDGRDGSPTRETTTESAGQPGFGVAVAVLALLGAALLARRSQP
ncbi:PGF-CTERM sorting domain-containing protein [Halobacteriaceae archaeon GCM10025711]